MDVCCCFPIWAFEACQYLTSHCSVSLISLFAFSSAPCRHLHSRTQPGGGSRGGPLQKRMARLLAPPGSVPLRVRRELSHRCGLALAVPPVPNALLACQPHRRPPESTSPPGPLKGHSMAWMRPQGVLLMLPPLQSLHSATCYCQFSACLPNQTADAQTSMCIRIIRGFAKMQIPRPTSRDSGQRAWGWEQKATLWHSQPKGFWGRRPMDHSLRTLI